MNRHNKAMRNMGGFGPCWECGKTHDLALDCPQLTAIPPKSTTFNKEVISKAEQRLTQLAAAFIPANNLTPKPTATVSARATATKPLPVDPPYEGEAYVDARGHRCKRNKLRPKGMKLTRSDIRWISMQLYRLGYSVVKLKRKPGRPKWSPEQRLRQSIRVKEALRLSRMRRGMFGPVDASKPDGAA